MFKNLFLFVLLVLILAAVTGCAEGLGDGPTHMAPAPQHPIQNCFSWSVSSVEKQFINPATHLRQGSGSYDMVATVTLQKISQRQTVTLEEQGSSWVSRNLDPQNFQVSGDYKNGETITIVISKDEKNCTWQ